MRGKDTYLLVSVLSILLLLGTFLIPIGARADTIPITEYTVPTASSLPEGITAGPDGNLWFTEVAGHKVAKITTSGSITEYAVTSTNYGSGCITSGPDGNIWFTEGPDNKIARMTTSGSVTEYTVPTFGSSPKGIAAGPDGNLWFTEDNYSANKIGKVTPTGTFSEYPITTAGSIPNCITPGPDGNMWFTEWGANKIGKITTAGSVTEYTIPTSSSDPEGITTGLDGNIWFAEWGANKIGKITTSGSVTEYSIPTSGSRPSGITDGLDGNLWFTESQGFNIGRITTTGSVTEFTIPTPSSVPEGITSGPDGNIWFTENNTNKIGVCNLTPGLTHTVTASVSGGNGTVSPPSQLVADGGSATVYISPHPGYTTKSVKDNGSPVTPVPSSSYTIHNATADHNVVVTFYRQPAPSSTFYFAEGTCRPGFDPYFCIQAPNSYPANVTLTYMRGDGTTATDKITVPGNSRATVSPRNRLGTGDDIAHDFSTVITCTNGQLIIAERPMYFNYRGEQNYNWNGGHDVVGAENPDLAFAFAEGTCRPGFETYFCIQNPGTTRANVDLLYLKADGSKPVKQSILVQPHSRSTVRAGATLGVGDDTSHDFSTVVECTNNQDIIAERSMYFNYMDGHNYNWTGGSDVTGEAYLSNEFYFAEGTCRPGFDAYFSIMNMTSNTANVTLTYMKGNGTTATDRVAVAPLSRSTVVPRNKLGTGDDTAHDFSTKVESDQPIIAERPMYFNYMGIHNCNWNGGHDVVGSAISAQAFAFAEGTCRPGFDTYFCIQNPGSTAADVTLAYERGSGAPVMQNITVLAHSRSTVRANDTLGAGNDSAHDFSTLVFCTNNQEIIAERPMYFNYLGGYNYNWTGGSDVVGVPGTVGAAAGQGSNSSPFTAFTPLQR